MIIYIVPFIFYALFFYLYKKSLSSLNINLGELIKKIIKLGVASLWNFFKPYAKIVIIVIVVLTLFDKDLGDSWVSKIDLIKELFNYEKTINFPVIRGLLEVIFVAPLILFVKLFTYLSGVQAIIGLLNLEITKFELMPVDILRGLMLSLGIIAVGKAANAQHINSQIAKNKEEIESIKGDI